MKAIPQDFWNTIDDDVLFCLTCAKLYVGDERMKERFAIVQVNDEMALVCSSCWEMSEELFGEDGARLFLPQYLHFSIELERMKNVSEDVQNDSME